MWTVICFAPCAAGSLCELEDARSTRMDRDDLERLLSQRTAEVREARERLDREVAERRKVEGALRPPARSAAEGESARWAPQAVESPRETTGALDRTSVEEPLQTPELRLADIVDFLPDATFVVDQEGKIIVWNRASEALTGVPAREMIGKGEGEHGIPFYGEKRRILIDLVRQPDHDAEKSYELVKREGNQLIAETGAPRIRGEKRILWGKASAIYDGDGRIVGAIESVRDVTEQKRVEAELQKHREHLEEVVRERTAALEAANVELTQYAQIVSHDLRAPLRAIHHYADCLREDLEGKLVGEQNEYLRALGSVVREAEALVEDVLTLARVGQHRLRLEQVDVGALLRSVIASLDLPPQAEVSSAGDWPTILSEPTLLRQIFQNLVENAVKFHAAPPVRIVLGWVATDEGHEFFVRDNGIGIDPRHHERIFRAFERLHGQDDYKGSGVGLAIVRKAATRLRGTVRVESEFGKGSTFSVAVPQALPEREGTAPSTGSTSSDLRLPT